MTIHNILLVEDDLNFRTALTEILKDSTKFQIIDTAVNGRDALSLLNDHYQQYDLILTDVSMPIMNGVELVKHVSENFPQLPIACISAYDEFDFVKESLLLGASDYILKGDITPQNFESLLSSLWQSIAHKKNKKKRVSEFVIDYLKQPSTTMLRELEDKINFDTNSGILLLSLYTMSPCNIKLFLNSLKIEDFDFYLLEDQVHEFIILVVIKNVKNYDKNLFIHQLKKNINQEITEFSFLSLSSHSIYLKSLKDLYHELEDMRNYHAIFEERHFLTYDDYQTQVKKTQADFSFELDHVNNNFTLTDLDEQIDQMIQQIKLFSPKKDTIEKCFIDFLNVFIKRTDSKVSYPDYLTYAEQIKRAFFLKEKKQILTETINKISNKNTIYQGQSAEVRKAINYIENNYQYDISLTEVAAYVDLSENYLSNLFKSETKINLTTFINKMRITQAKYLLKHTSLKSYEVAETVGFKNATYFSTVFKKIEKISVSDYKIQNKNM